MTSTSPIHFERFDFSHMTILDTMTSKCYYILHISPSWVAETQKRCQNRISTKIRKRSRIRQTIHQNPQKNSEYCRKRISIKIKPISSHRLSTSPSRLSTSPSRLSTSPKSKISWKNLKQPNFTKNDENKRKWKLESNKYRKQSLLMPINAYKWVKNAQWGRVSVKKEEKLCAKVDEIGLNLGENLYFSVRYLPLRLLLFVNNSSFLYGEIEGES